MLPGPLLFSPGQWRPGFPLSGMSWAGWYGPEPQIRDGVKDRGPGPRRRKGPGGGGEHCPLPNLGTGLASDPGREGEAGPEGKATWSPAVRWGGMGQSLLLCRGKGRLAVCPALSEGQEGTPAL